jgi:predicted Fe-Mo cluster-binding NifX family protein/quercetin dioxygenase-like cupin family protein/DNA-binding Xre family transcriptional regulator
MRIQRGFSLRSLAERSGLNANTLSLIENGKTSPSVSTLQQLASSLEVSITAFFESGSMPLRVVFTPSGERPTTQVGRSIMQNLGKDLTGNLLQPFVVTLQPGESSGEPIIVHTGHEFVFGLAGTVQYRVEEQMYIIGPGDALVFEAHLPHSWKNAGNQKAQFLLTLQPADRRDAPLERHFKNNPNQTGDIRMKIAVITDDGKTISQHFGRAPYYLVMSVENGQIIQRELREKMGHNQFSAEPHHEEHQHQGEHSQDEGSHGKHTMMAGTISDCQVLLCGGMGYGAYESMRRLNIQPVVTDLSDIEAAVHSYLNGTLVDHTEKLH